MFAHAGVWERWRLHGRKKERPIPFEAAGRGVDKDRGDRRVRGSRSTRIDSPSDESRREVDGAKGLRREGGGEKGVGVRATEGKNVEVCKIRTKEEGGGGRRRHDASQGDGGNGANE